MYIYIYIYITLYNLTALRNAEFLGTRARAGRFPPGEHLHGRGRLPVEMQNNNSKNNDDNNHNYKTTHYSYYYYYYYYLQ